MAWSWRSEHYYAYNTIIAASKHTWNQVLRGNNNGLETEILFVAFNDGRSFQMHAVDILTGGLASEFISMSATESGVTAWEHLYGDVKVRSGVRQEKDD